jgi:hypothetical protein
MDINMKCYESIFNCYDNNTNRTSEYFDSEYYRTNREVSFTDIDSKFNISNSVYIKHPYFVDEDLDTLVVGFLYEDNSVHDENINLIDFLI